jgi:hypothetical protein
VVEVDESPDELSLLLELSLSPEAFDPPAPPGPPGHLGLPVRQNL